MQPLLYSRWALLSRVLVAPFVAPMLIGLLTVDEPPRHRYANLGTAIIYGIGPEGRGVVIGVVVCLLLGVALTSLKLLVQGRTAVAVDGTGLRVRSAWSDARFAWRDVIDVRLETKSMSVAGSPGRRVSNSFLAIEGYDASGSTRHRRIAISTLEANEPALTEWAFKVLERRDQARGGTMAAAASAENPNAMTFGRKSFAGSQPGVGSARSSAPLGVAVTNEREAPAFVSVGYGMATDALHQCSVEAVATPPDMLSFAIFMVARGIRIRAATIFVHPMTDRKPGLWVSSESIEHGLKRFWSHDRSHNNQLVSLLCAGIWAIHKADPLGDFSEIRSDYGERRDMGFSYDIDALSMA